jgi:hypothetical protein
MKPWSGVRIPGDKIDKQLSHSRKADRGRLGAVMMSGKWGVVEIIADWLTFSC